METFGSIAKQKFDMQANLNVSSGITEVDMKNELNALAEKFSKTSKITVSVLARSSAIDVGLI